VPGADTAAISNTGFARRGLSMWLPDLWLQLLYKKLRVETEIAAVLGSVESTAVTPNAPDFVAGDQAERKLRQYGFAFELQQKLVEDRLRLNFKSGWASGDADAGASAEEAAPAARTTTARKRTTTQSSASAAASTPDEAAAPKRRATRKKADPSA